MVDHQILSNYRAWLESRGLARATLRSYFAVVRPFTTWVGDRGLTLLTVEHGDIVEWVTVCGAKCNRTRGQYVTRVDLLFKWMADEELRADVPSRRIPKPKFPQSLPRPLPTDGLYRALELADPRMRLMLSLAAYAGLRRAEIAGLQREQIQDRDDPPIIRWVGKGDKPRVVPLSPEITAALDVYQPGPRGPLFPGPTGKALTAGHVGNLIAKHLRACGVEGTAHRGRHWYGTEVYRATRDLLLTRDLMGHTDVSTTSSYAQFADDRAADAISRLPSRPRPAPDRDEAA